MLKGEFGAKSGKDTNFLLIIINLNLISTRDGHFTFDNQNLALPYARTIIDK